MARTSTDMIKPALAQFGEKLRVARALRDIPMRELAEAVGVSHNAIAKYEAGTCAPNSSILVALARELRVTMDWLMCPCPVRLECHAPCPRHGKNGKR